MNKISNFKIITNLLLILFFFKIKVFESIEIEGIQLIGKKNNGITSFYNIRYGVANRFQPAKLLSITEAAIMDEDRTSKIPKSYDLSTNKGSACPQDCSDTQQTSQKTFLCRGTEPETQSEACLTLNIFTSTTQIEEIFNQFSTVTKHVSSNNTQINMLSNVNNTLMNNLNKQKSSISSIVQSNMSQLKPVYVYIHGGLYLIGSSNSETNFGEKLAESGAIIVTINYRIGILGWLRAKNLSSGNMGFLDQRLALEWINKYIIYFGGDPTRVVLSGHSAGAKSVLCHSVTKESNKYFSGVIIHSGALSQNETNLKEAESMGEMAENIASEKCMATILSCTTKQLLEIQKEVRTQIVRSNPSKALHSWSPIVDGFIIKDSCRNLALSGSIPQNMNVIISTTNSEGVQFFRSFIAYLPAISRSLATSNFAFRYLVSRVFGPKAGEAMKIYSNNNFANSVSVASSYDNTDNNFEWQNITKITSDYSSNDNNETISSNLETKSLEIQKEASESMTESKNDSIKSGDKENNQIVSSSGFNLFQVGKNRDDEKWNGIIDDPVALAYARMIGDFIYSCPARMFIKKLSSYNPNVYGYFINSGFKWTEGLKKGYEINSNSFISEIFQAPKFSLRNTPKGVVCQNDDVACKTFVYDCSDARLVCHIEDIIWLFHTFPNKPNDNIDKVFVQEQNFASKFFSHLIQKSLGETESLLKKQQQIFRKSFLEPIEIFSELNFWNPFSNGGKILQISSNRTELISDFKSKECELWEWRNSDLSMTFHQLIDSKTIPQIKSNAESNTFTGITENNENENINLNINLIDENIESLSNNPTDNQFNQISILNQNDTEKDTLDNPNANSNESQ